MLSGDFGESFIAHLLAKKGVYVVRASTVGFDLFAIDSKGGLLPKNKMIGISVKARIAQSHRAFAPTIPMGSEKIKSAMKTWRVGAYMGVVIGSEGKMDAFLVPFRSLGKLRGKAKRADVLAASELYANKSDIVIKLF